MANLNQRATSVKINNLQKAIIKTGNYQEELIKLIERGDVHLEKELNYFTNKFDQRVENVVEYCSKFGNQMSDLNEHKMNQIFLIENEKFEQNYFNK